MSLQKSLLVALPIIFCTLTAAAQDSHVAPKEIQETWVGKSAIGSSATGAPISLKLQKDGVAAVAFGNSNDSGTWRLSDAGFCTTWKTIRAGTERCMTVKRDGSKLIVSNLDGSLNTVITEIK